MAAFLVQCPRCKNKMKYSTRDAFITNKRKRCVYCGNNFRVKENIVGNI